MTAREPTEWVDTVAAGANVLVDDEPDALDAAWPRRASRRTRRTLYGDGHAPSASQPLCTLLRP